METTTLNYYSKSAYLLKIASYLFLIGGVVAYLCTCYVSSRAFNVHTQSSHLNITFLPLISSLSVLLKPLLFACATFFLSVIVRNSEMKKAYLRHKAKAEGITFTGKKPF